MNLAQFQDPVSRICLSGAVVAFWSLTQEDAGLSPFNENILVTEFVEFSENNLRKSPMQFVHDLDDA